MSIQLPIDCSAEEEGTRHKSWLAFLLSKDYAMGMDSARVGNTPFVEGRKEYEALLAEISRLQMELASAHKMLDLSCGALAYNNSTCSCTYCAAIRGKEAKS